MCVKSRLYYEFTHSHRTRDRPILESRSVSYGRATAYLPVIELLKAYYQVDDRDDIRRVREKMTGKLFTLDEGLRPALPALLDLLDVPVDDSAWTALDPSQRRRRTLEAIKTILLRESQAQPLVVVFEDLHWIDGESQAFLDSLVESLPTAPILLLVNYRPEYHHGWGSKTYYTQQRIDPLTPEAWPQCPTSNRGQPHHPHVSFGSTIEILKERAVAVAQWGCARTRGSELSTYPLRAAAIFLESQVAGAVHGG